MYGLLGRQHFIHEQFPVVAHNFPADASVVVLVLDALATARVASFQGEDDDDDVVVVEIAVDKPRAGRLLTFERLPFGFLPPPPPLLQVSRATEV